MVTAGSNPQIETRIWADANAPVIHIESKRTAGTLDYGMTVTFQSLRTTEKAGVDTERNLADFTDSPFSVVVKPDTTETDSNAVYWYQRNTNSYFDELIEHQGLDASRYSDILTGRNLRGRLEGDGFTVSGTGVSKSNDASFRAAVTLHSEVVDSVATWKTPAERSAGTLNHKHRHTAGSAPSLVGEFLEPQLYFRRRPCRCDEPDAEVRGGAVPAGVRGPHSGHADPVYGVHFYRWQCTGSGLPEVEFLSPRQSALFLLGHALVRGLRPDAAAF